MTGNGFRGAPQFKGGPKSTSVHAEHRKGDPIKDRPDPEPQSPENENELIPDWLHLVHTLGIGELSDRLTINLMKLSVLEIGGGPWLQVRQRCFNLLIAVCRFVFGSGYATDPAQREQILDDLRLAPPPLPEMPDAKANTAWLEFFDHLLQDQHQTPGAVFFIGTIANLGAYNMWLWCAENDARRPDADRTELLRIQYLNACRMTMKHTLSNLNGGTLDLDPKKYDVG